jgi:dolichol-phosphate mannosyltransferase
VLTLDEYDPFLRGLSRWVGFKQTQVYYERESRFAGETKYSLLRSSNPYREFLRGITSFSTVPLYISLFIGFTTSFFSFLLILYTIIQRFVIKEVTSGWTSIIAVNLFLGGIILTTIGIIGIYIGKIHQDVKKRPRYFFESKMGFDDE